MRHLRLVAMLGFLLLPPATVHAIAIISTDASCSAAGVVTFHWHYDEYSDPVLYPEWTGWDVYRRSSADCGPWVRVNAEPYPRAAAPHDYFLTDTPPSPNTTWQYQVRAVDAARQQLYVLPCDCSPNAWTSCPQLAAPITKGRLVDWGWTWAVAPCLEGCWPAAYLGGQPPAELAPYVGTETVIAFYGTLACGTVEGCALILDHWDAGQCDVTPVTRSSWGRVKVVYR